MSQDFAGLPRAPTLWTTTCPASAAPTPTAPPAAGAAPTTSASPSATAPGRAACWPAASASTPLFDCRLPEDKALAVLHHLAEGCGVRQTARLVGVNKNTVVRLAALAGEHARQLHDELVAFSPSDPGGPTRREVVVRRQEGEALRPRRPR